MLRGLAEGMRVCDVVALVEREHSRRVSPGAVRHYRDSPKWQEAIAKERERMAAQLAELPVSQAYIRQRIRGELIEEHRDKPNALGAVRGLLLDAAKEAGSSTSRRATSTLAPTCPTSSPHASSPRPMCRRR